MTAASYVFAALQIKDRANARYSGLDSLGVFANQFAALMILLVLSPIMLVVSWLIWRRDGAPLFFAHYRVGRDGHLFRCLKFRTMYVNAEQMLADLLRDDPVAKAQWARDQKLENDPRITPIGRLLRSTSLDELPQLFNVLRGEMSLVGPRPITVGELTRYGRVRWHYLSVRPGMTGLWQVSGRNQTTYGARVAMDRYYVERRSVALNLWILFKTIAVVATRHGAR